MINPLAAGLIRDLRHDAHTREHFSIYSWDGKGTCGTVGCIAGTALVRAYGIRWCSRPKASNERLHEGEFPYSSYIEGGMAVLGLPSLQVAKQLFLPSTDWHHPLLRNGHAFFDYLSHNEHPDLDSVEKMIAWARNCRSPTYTPDACANAFEAVLLHERGYIDWAEAHNWRHDANV